MKIKEIITKRTTKEVLKQYIKNRTYSLTEYSLNEEEYKQFKLYNYNNEIYLARYTTSFFKAINLCNGECRRVEFDPLYLYHPEYNLNEIEVNKIISSNCNYEKPKKPMIKKYPPYRHGKISNEYWDAMSGFTNLMAIIYKNNLYGVIDNEYNIIINLTDKYKKIELLPGFHILLTDQNNYSALYQKNKGFIFNFDKKIICDDIGIGIGISNNHYYIKTNNKYGIIDQNGDIKIECIYQEILFINLHLPLFAIVDNKIDVYDKDFNKILSCEGLWNENFFILDDYIIFEEQKNIILFDLETKRKKILNNKLVKTEDDKLINLEDSNLDNLIKDYPYFLEDSYGITLCRTKKYGIEIISEITNNRKVRWFDSREDLEKIETYIYNNLLYPEKYPEKPKTKILC